MRLENRGKNLRATVLADVRRYTGNDCRVFSSLFARRLSRALYEHPALLAVMIYRYGQWVQFRCRIPVVRQICELYYYSLFMWARTRLQIEVPRSTAIDAGFRIDHFGSVLVNSQITAGKNFTITYGVVIGQTDSGVPTIGDNVAVGVGAKIIGGINVGNNVIVGAQALVNHDVPDNSVVAGVPARVIRRLTPPGEELKNHEKDRVYHTTHQD